VFETEGELAQIERYYRTAGASVFFDAPIVRNRPPPSERPATLAGGIKDGGVSVLKLPWANAGFVAVSTVQSAVLNRMPREMRNALHRGRYWRANANTVQLSAFRNCRMALLKRFARHLRALNNAN